MPPVLILLSLCSFVIGTGAFVISGILGAIGADLGVSVAAAGQATTVYALSTALLAPLALVATGGWPRRRALIVSMVVFALGNLLCAVATDLATLLAGRVVMGIGAMYTPVSAGIAVALVEPARRGKALALVFLGISMSYVVGLPLGAWLGLRYGWHWPVAGVGLAALIAAGALAWKLPAQIRSPGASFDGLPALLRNPAVGWTLALTLLYFTAIFLVFSYIGPVLQALLPMSGERMSFTLMLFGLSGVVGTLVGGWANDRFGSRRTLTLQLSVLGLMMALVPLTAGVYAAIVAVFVVWGTAGFGMMAPQQSRLASTAPAQVPLLLSLNTSMLYLGTAGGAALGGAFVGSVGFSHLPWLGLPFALLGLLTLTRGRRAAAAAAH